MTEPNETPDEQTQETPLETPVEPSEPTEPLAEGEEPGERGDAAETPPGEPAPGTPAGAVGDKELEKMFKRVETANASYAKRLGDIMGEEATVLQECPLCAAPFLGFIFPPAMKPVSPDVKAAVLAAVGEEVSEVSERDRYARQCDSCKGMGQTLSGSRTNRDRTLTCYDCQGRGWIPVGPERQGSTGATPLAVASDGLGEPVEQPPDADPWGRSPSDPDYGRMPQYTGRRQAVRFSFADLMLAGIFAVTLYALLNGWGQVAQRVYAVGSGSSWDERRNSSQVLVSPNALPNALRALRAARDEPWYRWIVKRQSGEHDHHALRSNGKPAACPVIGCNAVKQASGGVRYRGKERPIRCEGQPALAVRLGTVWHCARCGSVIRQVYIAPGRTDLDGVHSSVRCPDYASPLHVRTSLAAPAA